METSNPSIENELKQMNPSNYQIDSIMREKKFKQF